MRRARALAAVARRSLAGFPGVKVVESTIKDLDSSEHEPFDLMFAATACHWLDPAVRYRRAWELLPPVGHVAFWDATHVLPEAGDPLFTDLQQVYDEIGEGRPVAAIRPRPGELPNQDKHIEARVVQFSPCQRSLPRGSAAYSPGVSPVMARKSRTKWAWSA